jgi:hypothetical protein
MLTATIFVGDWQIATALALEQCECLCSRVAKLDLFGRYCARRRAKSGIEQQQGDHMDVAK